jgi:hypothetical protein
LKKILLLFFNSFRLYGRRRVIKWFSISINGNRIATTANYQQQVALLKKTVDKQSEKRSTLYYNYKDSNFDEQNELKNQGIILIDYLSNNAYYVSIDSKYGQSKVSQNIRTSIAVDPSLRLIHYRKRRHPRLRQRW